MLIGQPWFDSTTAAAGFQVPSRRGNYRLTFATICAKNFASIVLETKESL